MASKIDYTFDSTKETQAQYLARTQPSSTGTTSSGAGSDAFMTALSGKLMNQSDMISSANTGIEDKINQAIGGISKSTDSSSKAIESSYNRQIGYTQDQGQNSITGAMDSRGGFATNIVALRSLVQTTDKNVNDLEQRKQELILQNDSAGAAKIADLQMQGLQFKQTAMQQTFTNLLGMANFGLSAQQQQTQKEQFNKSYAFQESQAMSDIALNYGLSVQPGETLQSMYSRATKDMGANSPAALAIKTAQSQITSNNASTAKAYADMAANKPLDPTLIAALGQEYISNPQAVLGAVKTTEQLGQVLKSAAVVQSNNIGIAIQQDKSAGINKASAISKITNNANLQPYQMKDALDQIEKAYGADSAQPVQRTSLPRIAEGTYKGINSAGGGLFDFFTKY